MSYKQCFIELLLVLLFYTKSNQAHAPSKNDRSEQRLSTKNRQIESTIPRNLKSSSNGHHKTVVDLSKDFDKAADFNSNDGAKQLLNLATDERHIRGYVVLQHGQKVAEYTRDDLDTHTISPVWSVTKSWTSLIIGMMIEEGKLNLDDTLEDIWPDSSNDIWTQVKDAHVKKKTTIESLLTMTSGLTDDPFAQLAVAQTTKTTQKYFDVAGNNIVEALNYAMFLGPAFIGTFYYFGAGNIFGYVIRERTGLSPCEYAAKYIMPRFGIDKKEYIWRRNSDKVANTYFGLEMTTYQMAKFGQLYLQDGLVSETHQLISPRWIKKSFKAHSYYTSKSNSNYGLLNPYGYYGYLWWNMIWGDAMCAVGLGGQFVCIWPDRDMVMSISTEYSGIDFSAHAARLVYSASELSFRNSSKTKKKGKKTTLITRSSMVVMSSSSSQSQMNNGNNNTLSSSSSPTTTTLTGKNGDNNLSHVNTTSLPSSSSLFDDDDQPSGGITTTNKTIIDATSSTSDDDVLLGLLQFSDYDAELKAIWSNHYFEEMAAEAAAAEAETNNSWSQCRTSRATVMVSVVFLSMMIYFS